MKITLTSLLLTWVSLLLAQPTLGIELDSLPGTTFQDKWTFEAEDIIFQDPTGTTNRYFNFRDVDFEGTGPLRTWKIASDASSYAYFPDATICYTQNELNLDRFFRLDGDSNFVKIGSYYRDEGKDLFEIIEDPAIISLAIATFGSSVRDTVVGMYIVDGDTSAYYYIYERSMISYGSISTPEDYYDNCLIEKVTQMDSLGNILEFRYNFFHENLHNRILNIHLRPFPSNSIFYILYRTIDNDPVSVANINKTIENVYLSNNQLTIETSSEGTFNLTLFDVSGKLVFQRTESIVSGRNHVSLSNSLGPGYYVVLLVDESGAFYVKKLFAGY